MKKNILDYIMNNISKYNDYDDIKLAQIRYGLETIYLTLTKTIVIVLISIVFKSYKNLLLILLFYSLLRLFGSGLHATKSLYCWISSLIIFSILPILADKIIVSKDILIVISTISTVLILLHSPSDTEKRPMINKNKRLFSKILCTSISFIYLVIIIKNNNFVVNNILLISQLIETALILPISYKLFNLKYNNYKNI